jgi:probable rRNA maturation factor
VTHPPATAETEPVRVEIQLAGEAPAGECPNRARLRRWIRAAVGPRNAAELTLRIVGEAESADLNRRYRGRDNATNVLSFPPADDWPALDGERRPLGDIVVCWPVVAREAIAQRKQPAAHWAHIVIHGALHLIGFDHESDDEARIMEAEECKLLARFGFANPYSDGRDHPD